MKWDELFNTWGNNRVLQKILQNLNELDEMGHIEMKWGSEDKIKELSEELRDKLYEALGIVNDLAWAQCEYEEKA